MMMSAVSGLAGVLLLALAVWLLVRAAAKPPVHIRTESHRSQAEYDFNRRAGSLRQRGYACLLAAGLCLAMSLAMGLWNAVGAE
jgi:hypothetical protein